MEALENNTELYEPKTFSRKLDPEDNLKDRMIMKHLRRRKNNFLIDFDESKKPKNNLGEEMSKNIILHAPGVGMYLALSCAALIASTFIIFLNT
jgi:hypothetical protein